MVGASDLVVVKLMATTLSACSSTRLLANFSKQQWVATAPSPRDLLHSCAHMHRGMRGLTRLGLACDTHMVDACADCSSRDDASRYCMLRRERRSMGRDSRPLQGRRQEESKEGTNHQGVAMDQAFNRLEARGQRPIDTHK